LRSIEGLQVDPARCDRRPHRRGRAIDDDWQSGGRSVKVFPIDRESLPVPSILDLCHAVPIRAFEPGEILLAEAERSGLLYVLIEGEVEILKGDFQINVVSDPGAIFGETSVLLDIPHMATVRALTPCRAHIVNDGDTFLRSNKDIAYGLSKLLAQRLHGVTTYLVDLNRQFENQDNHLAMVDDVLEALVHQQQHRFIPGSDRDPGV